MDFSLDKFGIKEVPFMALCNPTGEQIEVLSGNIYDTSLTMRFNAMGEFLFKYPKSVDGNETELPAYELIKVKRLVFIQGFGYYQITNVDEVADGSSPYKDVTCNSREAELINKRVSLYSGTVKLYDHINPAGTILYDMVNLAPGWSVANVDTSLTTKYRTFNVSDTNVYSFIMNDVSTAFECVFFFDTENRTITAKTIENATTETDIYLSFNNVIKKSEFSEKADEITTCLGVYGGGGLTIRGVNPIGTDKIYNFDYYKDTSWMSQDLITAIDSWEAVVESNRVPYSEILLNLKTELYNKATLYSELDVLQSELSALEVILKVRIENEDDTSEIKSQIDSKNNEISACLQEISVVEYTISSLQSQLLDINASCSFSSNFTPSQLIELSSFIYENTYKNDNIISTDNMDESQIQDQQTSLYNQGVSVLSRVSQPRYEFEIDSINFTSIDEFYPFTEQLDLGCIVTAELEKNRLITAVLLEVEFSFNNPEKMKMTYSNRLRLDNGGYVYSDLLGQVVKTGATLSFNSEKYSNWEDEYKNSVSEFIDSALDTTRNEVISSTKQEIKISEAGLRGRQWIDADSYSPNEIWMTSNVIAFTDDAWDSAKTAIGRVSLPSGGTAYGIVADWIVGRMVIGSSLQVSNENLSFVVDSLGARLTNGTISVSANNSRIFLDPLNGFKIQQNAGGSWVDKFLVNTTTGSVTFSGTLSGASGSFTGSISASSGYIGGWSITGNGIEDPSSGNYIKTNGQIKLGNLTINGSTSYFDGTFSATNLVGVIENSQITNSLDAGKLSFGTIQAGVLFAGEVNWGADARLYNWGYGVSAISGRRILILQDDSMDTYVDITGGGIGIHGSNAVTIDAGGGSGTLSLIGEVYTDNGAGSGTGNTTIRHITTTSGDFYFEFVNGILVDVYS